MTEALTILQGDCREVLKTLPEKSVHCVVTSPPYFGLRDYNTAVWEGGRADCTHEAARSRTRFDYALSEKQASNAGSNVRAYASSCPCGATRVDAQLGLEETPAAYVANIVSAFREVWRVLRDDGVLWLNLGDSFASGAVGRHIKDEERLERRFVREEATAREDGPSPISKGRRRPSGLKPKDLIGIPWRVAFALQEDGWYLRADCVWFKQNVMPESVRDRPTRAHEYIFLLTKKAKYFYDADAIAEPASQKSQERYAYGFGGKKNELLKRTVKPTATVGHRSPGTTRNKRDVWIVPTKSYKGAHFATFPPDLVRPCILAGTSEHGCCAACGAPYRRKVEKIDKGFSDRTFPSPASDGGVGHTNGTGKTSLSKLVARETTGWEAGCTCEADVVPCTVLDPYAGAGTALAVAIEHGRRAVGVELNPEYIKLIEERTAIQVSLGL